MRTKSVLFVLFSLLVQGSPTTQAAQAPQAQPVTVRGTVIQEGTSEPIPGAEVLLVPQAANPAFNIRTIPQASANLSGRFAIEGVLPGRYNLVVHRDGFFGPVENGKGPLPLANFLSITIAAGQSAPDLAVRMLPGAVISGRVRDANGRLAPNVNVQAVALPQPSGRAAAVLPSRRTNNRGEYRLFWLPPGSYGIQVTPRQPSSPLATDAAPLEQEVATFYPGVSDMQMAKPVTVKAGDEISAIDITIRKELPRTRVTASPVAPRKMSGELVNATGIPAPVTATLTLVSRDVKTGPRFAGNVILNAASREFEVTGILPGSYDLYARLTDSRRGTAMGRAPLEITDKDLEGIRIVVHDSVDVRGVVRGDGNASAIDYGEAKISLKPQGTFARITNSPGATNSPQTLKPDGSFTVTGVTEGEYAIQVSGLPPDSYIADIRQSGARVQDAVLQVGDQTPEPIEVTIAANGGTLEGTVGEAAASAPSVVSAWIVLVPSFRTVSTDPQGHFSMRGVPPGEYRIFASEGVQPGAGPDREFLSRNSSQGVAVTVMPSSTTRVLVPVASQTVR